MADQDFIDFRAGLDPTDVLTSLKMIEKSAKKHFQRIDKETTKLNTGLGKALHRYVGGAKKQWAPMLKGVEKEYAKVTAEVDKLNDELKIQQDLANKGSEEEQKNAKKRIKEIKALRRERQGFQNELDTMTKEVSARFTFDRKGFVAAAKEAGSELIDPFNRAMSGDFAGAMESAGVTLGGYIEDSFKAVGSKFEDWGAKWGEKAQAKIEAAKLAAGAKGGAGAGLKMAGAGAKTMGGLGKVVGWLAKLGPILTMVSGLMVGLVKMFIDAEAQAKSFNKEILSTAGSASFLHRNMGSAAAGADDLGRTLKDIRDAAYSLDNLDWGINAETHSAVLNALTQEGVSLARMRTDMERTAKATDDMAGYVKSWGNLTQMSVAYSRALGISVSELNQMQTQMMTDMGMSLTDVQLGFSQMTRSAEDAGIAGNKFFGIIRTISQDLSLYNTRMSDAIGLLGELGKVMNPRNAEAFLQASLGVIKNMGRTEKLKVALLAGGGNKGAKAVTERDINKKTNDLAEKLSGYSGQSAEAMKQAIEAGGTTFSNLLQGMVDAGKLDKEEMGTLREAGTALERRKTQMGRGKFGQGLAMGDVGAAGQLTIMKKALLSMGGGNSLMGASGTLALEMMAENLGVSEEMLNQFISFEAAMNDQREALKKGLKNDDVRKRLEEAGIRLNGNEADEQAAIMAAGDDQIMAALEEDTKKQLEKSVAQIDYQKETSEFQTSMLDKMKILTDWLMNVFYNAFLGMWDSIASILGFLDKDKGAEIAAARIQDTEVSKLYNQGTGDRYQRRTQAIEGTKGRIQEGIQQIQEQKRALLPQLGTAKGEELELVKDKIASLMDASATLKAGLNDMYSDDATRDMKHLGEMLSLIGSTTGGVPAAATGTSPVVAKKQAKAQAEAKASAPDPAVEGTTSAVEEQTKVLKQNTDPHKVERSMNKATLDAMRTALFEYWLYSEMDRGTVLQAAANGNSPASIAAAVGAGATQGKTAQESVANLAMQQNAAGGVVASIAGGMAQVRRLPPGEGMAAVGRGERIVPRGAGGGGGGQQKVVLELKGDLGRFIEAKVVNGVADFERNRAKR